MQFTARQLELARWALRNGQSEASFARDNAMPIGSVKWLFEMAATEIRKEKGARPLEVKQRLNAAMDSLMKDAECIDLFFSECRPRSDGKPSKILLSDGRVLI